MCDYCDCRRIPEIAGLGQEHEIIQDLADEAMRIAKAGGSGLAEAIDRLRGALSPHVNREEGGIFAQAKQAGMTVEYYVEDLEEDHRRFAAILDRYDLLGVEALEAFVDELHRHIAVEEYDLFPAAAQLLGDEQWQLVGIS